MSKEKLEKEAEESAKKFFGKPTDLVDLDNLRIFKNGYLASAEPREKQIQIDAEQIRALQKQNGELTDKVNELEETISKLREQLALRYDLEDKIKELEALNDKLQNCWNCNKSFNKSCSFGKKCEAKKKKCKDWESTFGVSN